MRKIGIQYERSKEIDIRIFSGDSLIRHGDIWKCGGTTPIILNSELNNRKGKVSSGVRFTLRKTNPVKE